VLAGSGIKNQYMRKLPICPWHSGEGVSVCCSALHPRQPPHLQLLAAAQQLCIGLLQLRLLCRACRWVLRVVLLLRRVVLRVPPVHAVGWRGEEAMPGGLGGRVRVHRQAAGGVEHSSVAGTDSGGSGGRGSGEGPLVRRRAIKDCSVKVPILPRPLLGRGGCRAGLEVKSRVQGLHLCPSRVIVGQMGRPVGRTAD
jgi:hypothetical protein